MRGQVLKTDKRKKGYFRLKAYPMVLVNRTINLFPYRKCVASAVHDVNRQHIGESDY